uniref:glucomannan 4-beta-mannosyltransferase n=1 Tax=Daucus carota subsp. sativus TaxID=79200 RepID=A0A164ZE51_DAUCS
MESVDLEALVYRGITLNSILDQLGMPWDLGKWPLVVPLLKLMVNVCLVMSVMLFLDRVYMGVVKLFIKLLGRKPEKNYKWEAMKDDIELGSSSYPMVLVQIPMYNEKEVYQLSIGAACDLSWPSDRIIIQVLDDSTDLAVKKMVEAECKKWKGKGKNIKYEIRDNRNGYKAGALKQGLKHSYVSQCDFVAIFDADFQPESDFLKRTIPFFVHNPEIGLVQARWKFANADECLMTRMQEMSLNYHFIVEQEVGSQTYAFFGFNGTAGVWRIKALDEAGGWKDRTTVEDMDLAVRATLQGWKFVFVNDIKVANELPSTFKAFRYQQHRWSCGPANLFKKMAAEIITNKVIIFWVVFENVMAMHRTKATIIGLLEIGRVNEWVVTEKLGDALKPKASATSTSPVSSAPVKKPKAFASIWARLRWLEISVGMFIFLCGWYDFCYGKNHYFIYLFLQAISFFVVGLGYVGTFVSN